MKNKKKTSIKVYETRSGWVALSLFGRWETVAEVHYQPTRKRAVAMVRAALLAGGYEVEVGR